MKKLVIAWLGVCMLLIGITSKAQTADEIMERHVAALGGIDAWNNIKTVKMTGGFSQGGVDIGITQTIAVGRALRMDVSAMGNNGFQIVTRKEGWSYMPFMGPASKLDTMKPELVQAFQKQMDVKGHQMLDYKTNGTRIEYAGRDTINKIPCYKVRFTDPDGNISTAYFDCTSYYILRTDTKVKQDEQEQEVSVVYDNYKKLDGGVVMPMSINAGGVEIVFKTIEVNKPLDERIFIPSLPDKK